MKLIHLTGVALLLMMAATAAPQAEKKAGGVFAPLEKGQTVSLKEVAGRYDITRLPKK